MTDSRGKIIRVGDCVHKVASKRSIRKGIPNGRVLGKLGTQKVQSIIKGDWITKDDRVLVRGEKLHACKIIKE